MEYQVVGVAARFFFCVGLFFRVMYFRLVIRGTPPCLLCITGFQSPAPLAVTLPHGGSRLVQAMSAWSVKTGHAPSRHRRDAKIYGHATTAMHEIEFISPPIEYTPPYLYLIEENKR